MKRDDALKRRKPRYPLDLELCLAIVRRGRPDVSDKAHPKVEKHEAHLLEVFTDFEIDPNDTIAPQRLLARLLPEFFPQFRAKPLGDRGRKPERTTAELHALHNEVLVLQLHGLTMKRALQRLGRQADHKSLERYRKNLAAFDPELKKLRESDP
jgi:hypothetical protein